MIQCYGHTGLNPILARFWRTGLIAITVSMSESELRMSQAPVLPRVAAGEQSAVTECLTRYGGLVWSLARRFSPDQEAAEDAMQEIFLRIWKAAAKFDPKLGKEVTFIATIARRKLIDLNRKKKWNPSGEISIDEISSTFRTANEIVETNDEARKARELLQQLPSDQQTVIKLSVYNGMSHAKIAEATGLSLGTVKTHIRRGLIRLRKTLYGPTGQLSGGPTS